MDNGSTLLNSKGNAHWRGPRGPRLVLEYEPGYRVFFGNLADLLLRKPLPTLVLASKPAPYWHDVFVYTGAPWGSVLESALCHLTLVLALIILSPMWAPRTHMETQRWHESYVAYYRPSPTFPASKSSPPRLPMRRENKAEVRHALRVAREVENRPGSIVAPPNIAALTAPPPLPKGVLSTPVAPAVPLAAARSQRQAPPVGTSIVGPPPEVKQAASWHANPFRVVVVAPGPAIENGVKSTAAGRLGTFQTVAVAPAPKVGAVSGRAGVTTPKVDPVAPSPSLQGSIGRGGKSGGIGLDVEVVAPAPKLPADGQGTISGGSPAGLSGTGSWAVVPPPPSVGDASTRAGSRADSFGSGMEAVPPPPSVGGAGRLTGPGRGGLPVGSGLSAVPPPPSVSGVGRLTGPGRGGVPVGSGLSAVPPPPSIEGTGGATGRGDRTLLADANPPVVPPPQSTDNVGESNTDDVPNTVAAELPMRIVGLAFALPGTSFSASYEVFIAEKELSGHRVQLIKLVYWFLPYQRRFSEYHPDASKIYKLRVTRDRACDESLVHMTVSPTGQVSSGLSLTPEGRNTVLPCYRTSADNHPKETSRKR
jgi:hypothetical protein